jgi:hypothetical protein
MSYRNPKVIVDTQSGQHVTNMIKSVSNSYSKFAASEAESLVGLEKAKAAKAEKAEKAEALRIKKEQARMAEADAKSEEYAGKLHSTQSEALDINLNQAQEGIAILHENIVKDKSLLTPEQRQAIAKQNAIVKNAPSIIKEGIASMQEFTDYYEEVRKKKQGEYGSLYVGDYKNDEKGDKVSPNAMYDALIGYPDTKAKVKGHMDYSTGIFTVEVFSEDGVSLGKMTPGSEDNMRKPQIVPNMHKPLEAINKKIAEKMLLKDPKSPSYQNQEDIEVPYPDGTTHYHRLPSKEVYSKAAKQEVKNLVGSMSAGDLIAMYNTKINPNSPLEYKKEWGENDKETIAKIEEGMVGFLIDNHGQTALTTAADFGTTRPKTSTTVATSASRDRRDMINRIDKSMSVLKNNTFQGGDIRKAAVKLGFTIETAEDGEILIKKGNVHKGIILAGASAEEVKIALGEASGLDLGEATAMVKKNKPNKGAPTKEFAEKWRKDNKNKGSALFNSASEKMEILNAWRNQ